MILPSCSYIFSGWQGGGSTSEVKRSTSLKFTDQISNGCEQSLSLRRWGNGTVAVEMGGEGFLKFDGQPPSDRLTERRCRLLQWGKNWSWQRMAASWQPVGGEGSDLLGKGFSLMKRRCDHLCGLDDDKEEAALTMMLTLGFSKGDAMLAFGAVEELEDFRGVVGATRLVVFTAAIASRMWYDGFVVGGGATA
ncbi:hypothetical protein B296_00028884 [Ensete ventricosum]|uniref:Uncharacterized protein n=1 Tax=Ensete ventricosum TaxID=4639 RepID=A0A426Z0L8_ENSVE|nr:hypothetical protein B296_00028884 [Ensete ventricosum]